jgi:phospholipid-binding lipoprotein MlaA
MPQRRPPRRLPILATALLALGLGACAAAPPADDPEAVAEFRENNDPAEPFNRAMFDVHQAIDRTVLIPVARGYRAVLPPPVRTGIRNALGNLRTPVILVNDMLQGEPRRAGDTLGRFVVNSTIGLGGLFDVAASRFGVRGHSEDFGQTLGTWGMGEGPFLFIPVIGPSNPRDLAGSGVDVAIDPFTWVGQGPTVQALTYTRAGVSAVNTREGLLDPLEQVERGSLDYYAALRSIYRQRRQAEIANRLDGAAGAAATGTGFGVGN